MLRENTINQGDCIKLLNRELKRRDGRPFVDLIFADPPFNIGYEYDEYHDKVDHDQYVAWILRPQEIPDSFFPEENTWYFSRVCGTTVVVAYSLGRRFLGIELSAEYVQQSRKRLEEAKTLFDTGTG